jgi:xanthine dehydrogenase molybdenum-binding subunit
MKVHLVFNGGSFGGKISLEHVCVGVAILAKKLNGAPVSLLQNRSDEQGREDSGLICNLKIGVKNDGTITAIHLNPSIVDVGDTAIEGEGFIWAIVCRPKDMLEEDLTCPNIVADNKLVLTSKVGGVSFRCEKNQTAYILGKVTQLVSARLKMDPTEIALKNANVVTDSLAEVIKAGKEAIDWDKKWHAPGTEILENGNYHGMGFAWSHMWHAGGKHLSTAV